MHREVMGRPWEGPGLEHLRLAMQPDGTSSADGLIIGMSEDQAFRLHYELLCDAGLHLREVHVSVLRPGAPHLSLWADGHGQWTGEDGQQAPALDGCLDVDLSATAFTNTLPIRRLGLQPKQSAELAVAYIDLALMECPSLHDLVLAAVGHALRQELDCPSPAGALYANAAAHFLAMHLLRTVSSVGAALPEPPHRRLAPAQLERVVDFVQTHLSQDLSLACMAQHIGFSAYHFARLFRRTTGESPHQYVLRKRVERARLLLEQPNLPLVEVAFATGFANQSHLTQQFRRQFGVTPSVYRREHAPHVRASRPKCVTTP
jgi:AraC-like DNA-binding protein